MSAAEGQVLELPSAPRPGRIYGALASIMAEVGAVAKGRFNEQQKYRFRGIDDLYKAVQDVMAKYRVVDLPRVVKMEREERTTSKGGVLFYVFLTVDHHFFHEDGSSAVATTVGEAMDSGDKASNKAMAAADKYSLLQVFKIPVDEPDRDTEEQSHEVAPRRVLLTPAQVTDVRNALAKLYPGEPKDPNWKDVQKDRAHYVGWACGRMVDRLQELTLEEGRAVMDKADNGEMPPVTGGAK